MHSLHSKSYCQREASPLWTEFNFADNKNRVFKGWDVQRGEHWRAKGGEKFPGRQDSEPTRVWKWSPQKGRLAWRVPGNHEYLQFKCPSWSPRGNSGLALERGRSDKWVSGEQGLIWQGSWGALKEGSLRKVSAVLPLTSVQAPSSARTALTSSAHRSTTEATGAIAVPISG